MAMSAGVRHIMHIKKTLLEHYSLFKDDPILSLDRLSSQGYCNDNYLASTLSHKQYLIRHFNQQGIDRRSEYRLQRLAGKKQLTAKPYFLDLSNDIMVTEFLSEGTHRKRLARYDLHHLALTVYKLHKLRFRAHRFNPRRSLVIKGKKLRNAVRCAERSANDDVLSHNDLNPLNILFGNRVKVIDWEYASINDRYFDLASVCEEFRLKRADEIYFLKRYFRHKVKIDQKKLEAYKIIYRSLCEQWFDINTPPSL